MTAVKIFTMCTASKTHLLGTLSLPCQIHLDERAKKVVLPTQRKYAFFILMIVIELVWLFVMCDMAFL